MFMQKISTDKAPKAIGPYSQAVKLGDFVYLSGSIPVDPKTNEVVDNNIEAQAKQVLENIVAVLDQMNLEMRHVVKTTVFLSDMNNFTAFNEIYGQYFKEPYPARSCVEVARLPKDVLVEIECMAIDTLVYEQQMMAQQGGCSGGCGGCGSDSDCDCDSGCCSE